MLPIQHLHPTLTTWHITFGTYGTRLHGSFRPTVDKQHNQRHEEFLHQNVAREKSDRERMKFPPRLLTKPQRLFAEEEILAICERGGWEYRICAAAADHIHVLCDADPAVHGEKVRRLIKRWLGQSLSAKWLLPDGATWWAEEGSNIAVKDEKYLNNCFRYIFEQRITERAGASSPPTKG